MVADDAPAPREASADHREAVYRALGHLVVEFNELDSTLTMLLWYLVDPTGVSSMHVVADLPFAGKVRLARELLPKRMPEADAQDFLDLFLYVERLGVLRNRYVHSKWAFDDNEPQVVQFGKHRESIPRWRAQASEVSAVAHATSAATARLYFIMMQWMSEQGIEPVAKIAEDIPGWKEALENAIQRADDAANEHFAAVREPR